MLEIDCYNEKCLLIAYYFCGKGNVKTEPKSVFEMWSNYWKNDFRVKGHPLFKVSDGKLVHNKNDLNKDDSLLREYNKVFQKAYKWIQRYVSKHTKTEIGDAIIKQRVRQLAELKTLAAKKDMKAYMFTRDVKSGYLAHYQLVSKGFRKDGTYSTLLHYLTNIS